MAFNNQEQTNANATKDLLLSIIAHDAYQVFINISDALQLLETQFQSFSQKEIETTIIELNQEVQSTSQFYNNLMFLVKNYRETLILFPKKVKLQSFLSPIITSMQHRIRQKKISIHLDIPENTTVYIDQTTMQIVIRNLLDNAIKFTGPKGSIHCRTSDDQTYVCLHIQDTGRGVSQAQLKTLFEEVKPLEQTKSNQTGYGVGLFLCKILVLKNNGQIGVNSQLGRGSEFTVALPRS